MDEITRRAALSFVGGAPLALLAGAKAEAAGPAAIVWRDPGCGCCTAWAKSVEAAFGVQLRIEEGANMAAVKQARGVPGDLRSCHTALIGGYVFEGHVPPKDIRRLLRSRRRDVVGLAVPGMPAGSPGMEMGGQREPFRVVAFGRNGRRATFASHG